MRSTWTARARRAALVTVVLLVTGTATATVSSAEPDDDVSASDVRAAREAVRSAAVQVASLEVALATEAASVEDAWTDVAMAAEDYTEALVARDAAVQDAERTAAQAAAAALDAEVARGELGEIAMQVYRSGGSLDGLTSLLSAEGFEDLVARTTAMEQLGDRAQRAVQRLEAADLVATTLQRRADDAADAARAVSEQAEHALAGAESARATAEERAADVARQREAMIAELAVLRRTSVEAERARQDVLDAERRAREDAAAAADNGATPDGPPAPPTEPPTAPPTGEPPTTPPPTTPPPGPPTSEPPTTAPPTSPPPTTPPPAPPTSEPPTTPPPPPPPPPPAPPSVDPYGEGTGSQRGSAAQGAAAVAWAVDKVGTAYGWGAAGPEAFDCSGLTSKAWAAAGLSINRTSRDQYRQVRKISYASMRPGDLIFWGRDGSDPGSIGHVAMFIGNGQVVEAPRPGVAVRVADIRWSGTMPFAGRP